MEQISLWECMYETKNINKPIRLIECFAGIGSQFKALKKVFGDKVESYKIVEWAYNSIVAYNNIHLKDKTDYSKDLTKEEIISKIKGISTNYNEPLSEEQLNKKPLVWLQKAYNNIKATHNLIDIMKTKGDDLEIVDKDKYEYILTYSFPCQDLSLAGLGKGMDLSQADGGTRSGLLWEIKRILEELKAKDSLPQILLMENVPMLISKNHIHNFKKWDNFLTGLGYKNYTECLNSKDFGIPQNRNRCFMVSVLGDYNYTFPRKQKLNIKLKDMLEENVDEKYYLSNKMIDYITADNEKWTGNNGQSLINKDIASTINTGEGSKRCDASNYVSKDKPLEEIAPTIKANKVDACVITSFVENKYKEFIEEKGYVPEFFNPYNKDEIKDVAPTQTTQCGSITSSATVLVKDKRGNEFLLHKDTKQLRETIENNEFEKDKPLNLDLYNRSTYKHSQTLTDAIHNSQRLFDGLRIRKLTPKETTRLMGFEDSDYDAMKQDLSEMAIYHCCGDSIVVNVLENIFKQMKGE